MNSLFIGQDNTIIIIGDTYHYVNVQDGNYAECSKEEAIGIFLDGRNMVIPLDLTVIEVESIPQEVTPGKYCYTVEKGFYPNPNWKEPPRSQEQLDEAVNLINSHQAEVDVDVDFRLSKIELGL